MPGETSRPYLLPCFIRETEVVHFYLEKAAPGSCRICWSAAIFDTVKKKLVIPALVVCHSVVTKEMAAPLVTKENLLNERLLVSGKIKKNFWSWYLLIRNYYLDLPEVSNEEVIVKNFSTTLILKRISGFFQDKSLSFMLTGVVKEYVWLQVMFQNLAFVTAKTSKQSNTPAT